jgi:hypothetical protein
MRHSPSDQFKRRKAVRPGQGLIERDLLAHGIFTSIPDLARKIRRYIQRYNEDPTPIRWTYSNPAHRITTDSAVTSH